MRKLATLGVAAVVLAAGVVPALAIPTSEQIENQARNVPSFYAGPNGYGYGGFQAQTPAFGYDGSQAGGVVQPGPWPQFFLNGAQPYWGR